MLIQVLISYSLILMQILVADIDFITYLAILQV